MYTPLLIKEELESIKQPLLNLDWNFTLILCWMIGILLAATIIVLSIKFFSRKKSLSDYG